MNFVDKHQKIIDYIKGKTVLDLGCIMHNMFEDRDRKDEWLHRKIVNSAKKVVGIDILKEHIPALRAKGYDIRWADVEHLENLDIADKFDVVIAGELLEHLSNIGLFLEGVKRFFHKDTIMIITTPNVFWFYRFQHAIKNKEIVNQQHTCWFSFKTLAQLLERHGYQGVEYTYWGERYRVTGVRSLLRAIRDSRYRNTQMAQGLFFVVRLEQCK